MAPASDNGARVGAAGAALAPSYLLLHGAATTGAIWQGVRRALGARPVLAPDRPSSGDLDQELDALRDAVRQGAALLLPGEAPGPRPVVFGGVSGGATLGLAALAAGVPVAAAVLHEPAVGSLLPGLLAPMAEAFAHGGVPAFARALYGPAWQSRDAPADSGAVARDLAMFTRFEPTAPAVATAAVVVTVGERSPEVRHRAADALRRAFGLRVEVLPGCGHAAHLEAPERFAATLTEVASRLGG